MRADRGQARTGGSGRLAKALHAPHGVVGELQGIAPPDQEAKSALSLASQSAETSRNLIPTTTD